MSLRVLVYTCMFGGYDRVFPPVRHERSVDYVLVTEEATPPVKGWRRLIVDPSALGSARSSNRHFKMLAHRRELSGFDVSIYVDGNIRVIGGMLDLAERFVQTGAALGVSRHPKRSSVAEEAACCLAHGKLQDGAKLNMELSDFASEGFPDKSGLMEASVLLKNHRHPGLDPAMELWWKLFERYDSRDQISLPFVKWKLGLPVWPIEPHFREPNPHFGAYPHLGKTAFQKLYAATFARSYDSVVHALILRAWHAKWSLQRSLRRRREA